jgi:predicted anti-sigma-YlaC factor YlaD
VNCRKAGSLLSAYMDGELTGAESLRVRGHLAECAACREEHDSLLETKTLIASMAVASPDAEFERRLLASVGAVPDEPRWRRRAASLAVLGGNAFRVRTAAAFAAFGLVALAVSVRVTLTSGPSPADRFAARRTLDIPPPTLREQDIRFARDSFERPQPVNYRPAGEPIADEDRADIRPLPAWESAEPTSAP